MYIKDNKYYEQLNAHKFDNLEMDQFLERHKLPKPTAEEINNLKRLLFKKLNQ